MPATRSRPTKRKPQVAREPKQPQTPGVYVLSDSTGNLARHMLGAFLTQFPRQTLAVRFESFVRTSDRLLEILQEARREKAAICHAMISIEFKRTIEQFCAESHLLCRDLTGGIVEFLADVAGVQPQHNVNALHQMDEAYKERIGALEFTLSHDDGLGLESLQEADIVLAGVSRTSKSPTSIYLAQQGYRVANVALALGVAPPRQLLNLPREKVVGLIINPAQLTIIRTHRRDDWKMGETNYGNPDHIARELAWARRLFADQRWNIINVTDQAIEETAARAISVLGLAERSSGSHSSTTAELE